MQAFARELQSMASRLERLSAGQQQNGRGAGKKNRRSKGGNTLAANTSSPQPSLSISQGKSKRGRGRGRGRASGLSVPNMSTGDVLITKTELVSTVKLPANSSQVKAHIDVIPDSFPWLKNFFGSFDRIRYESLQFYWKPLVGTTYGGAISMGFDWDWGASDTTRDKISGFSPNRTLPLYADGESKPLTLPKSRLQSRLWYVPKATNYEDKGPGKVLYCADGKSDKTETTIGDIWVKYTVVLSGTNPA